MSNIPTATAVSDSIPDTASLVLFCNAQGALAPDISVLAPRQKAAILKAISVCEFKGEVGDALLLPALLEPRPFVIIAGTGKAKDHASSRWLEIGAGIVGAIGSYAIPSLWVDCHLPDGADFDERVLGDLATGMRLRAYRFEQYKTRPVGMVPAGDAKVCKLEAIHLHLEAPDSTSDGWAAQVRRSDALVAGVNLARDLVNQPPNILGPAELAAAAHALTAHGVDVEIVSADDLETLGFGAMLGVAHASSRPASLVLMRWPGTRDDPSPGDKGEGHWPVALVGKGVTFDSGGISLKPSSGMEKMKGDMAGAAAVIGAMATIARRKAPSPVLGAIGCVENMPGGSALRPGDVVKSLAGSTIEVVNTDAEGRLVLADVITYIRKRFRPEILIDLATLTGAIMIALGNRRAGLFTNDDNLADALLAAARGEGEGLWRLPLGSEYRKANRSKIADIKNTGGRLAGSATAASFLQHFAEVQLDGVEALKGWAHIDIAGTGFDSDADPVNATFGTGYAVRLLNRYVEDHWDSGASNG